jgi:hypothetical protein
MLLSAPQVIAQIKSFSRKQSLVYWAEFLYTVELCPHNTGSVHNYLQTIYIQTEYKPTAWIV